MRKPLLLLFNLFVFLNFAKVSAQQLPLFTQYRDYYGYVNPASISIDLFTYEDKPFSTFGISHRRQWVNPTFPTVVTTVGRGEVFFGKESDEGPYFLLGGYFMSDKAGSTSFNGAYGRAAYINVGDDNIIGAGFTAGVVSHVIDPAGLKVYNAGDPLQSTKTSTIGPDVGVGIFGVFNLSGSIKAFGGLSVPQVLGLDLTKASQDRKFGYKQIRHYYQYAGLFIETGDDDDKFLECSIWGKYVEGLPYHTDLNFRYQITNPFWIGTGISTTKNLHFELGLNIGELGDDILRKIAIELYESIRNNATIDWTLKESVRARLRVNIKRILKQRGYPPDRQEQAIKLILEQAERLA